MGLESLFLFTLLGGMAAGAYAFETCFQRTRTGERPWLVPLVIVVLFAVGMIAASTHVQSIPRALASVSAGTVNFGSGMVKEVAASGIFFVLVIVDLIITLAKKQPVCVARRCCRRCCGVHGAYGNRVCGRVWQCRVEQCSSNGALVFRRRFGYGSRSVRRARVG